MPDDNDTPTTTPAVAADQADAAPAIKVTTRRRTPRKAVAKVAAVAETDRVAAPDAPETDAEDAPVAKATRSAAKKTTAAKTTAKKTAAKKTTKKAAAKKSSEPAAETVGDDAPDEGRPEEVPAKKAVKKTTRSRSTSKKAAAVEPTEEDAAEEVVPGVVFQAPDAAAAQAETGSESDTGDHAEADETDSTDGSDDAGEGGARRRRRRGGRRRRKSSDGDDSGEQAEGQQTGDQSSSGSSGNDSDAAGSGNDSGDGAQDGDESGEAGSRRRRRRRRSGDGGEGGDNGDAGGSGGSGGGSARQRKPRSVEDQITSVAGSTRLEAKKQRRREGREAGRRRAPIVSEAEFLTRRESVERVMVVRQRDELTQIGVLEDKVLVEHYVSRESQTSLIGNIYLGRVQNVLPSMEAAFIDIGRGRNAVLYAGEVNWSALGHKDGQARKIESVLSSGQTILVQVSKDPIGQKGARLTSQISLAGRFLVYVPDGTTSGISRKLPDTERTRLKTLLKEMVPDTAGVIVRTAAEGASEDELVRDVERLTARFAEIEKLTKGSAPQLLYGEPDLTVKVVRDLFTEDFVKLVVQGDDAWQTIQGYVSHVAPDLEERLESYDPAGHNGVDLFSAYRVEEQIAKALDRKVWLPSGGSLVIDRTEAMTVVDVNTGKFTGSGGNLEETVTKNNLEAAEEVVRQLRLRDIGGIIVVDFIDMVLESNRDLVLRRLVECLGRDRTRHQVAEVTSLGLVQMTRKRIGTGLVESFSQPCEHCAGRGVVIQDHPVESGRADDEPKRGGARRTRGGRGRGSDDDGQSGGQSSNGQSGNEESSSSARPSPREFAAMARHLADNGEDAPQGDDVPESAAADGMPPMVDEPVTEDTQSGSGQAAPVEAAGPTSDAVIEVVGGTTPDPEPVVAPVATEPEPPKVVTRTRRRSASRPAGPPVAEAHPETVITTPPPSEPTVQAGTSAADEHPEPEPEAVVPDAPEPVDPVPVKRRGFRRR